MSKRFSSREGWLGFALDLARKQQCEKAQEVLRKLAKRELSSANLRLAAQVNNRCELLEQAEACWLEIARRNEMEPGDHYMLGSLQARLSKPDAAAQSLEREIALATSTGNTYFLGSSSIRLADLLLKLNKPSRAKEVLLSVDDEAGDYIEGAGFRTKAALLREASEKA